MTQFLSQDLKKVFHMVSLFQNGWFLQRNEPFSVMRERNIITSKALFDFFDTMNDWNTVAMNLIWARRNINEYQFWHLVTHLVTHNRHFNNLVLPAFYEVFPGQFFTADVMDQAANSKWNQGNSQKVVIMSNYTSGALGSNDDDSNDNVYDLNDVKHQNNKIRDWDTLKKVVYEIKNQLKLNNNNSQGSSNRNNKDVKNKIDNNYRNLNQGNKFDNNGEDRMVYFTEDLGLNNYYYFSRVANSRIVDNKQMYNNNNNKDNFNQKNGQISSKNEVSGKIYRRGERYVYQMKQLLARYNLERKSNGLDNVKDITLDGTVENGVYPNLRYTNGLQMTNRQNDYDLQKQHNMKLIQVTKDFENRFYRAVDQGFVETVNGNKVNLQSKDGVNILGNLLQGNSDSANSQYYHYLEYYYRLLLGGNNNDNVDFNDKRFVPTVLDNYETSMRDSVFWQIMKRITSIVDKFQNKLTGYKTADVQFNGVKINNVKVDKMVTTFNYFDADITNGINANLINKKISQDNNNDNSESNESNDSENDSENSDSNSNENSHFLYGQNYKNNQHSSQKYNNHHSNKNSNSHKQNKNANNNNFNSDESDSNESNDSGSNEMSGNGNNYRNGNRDNNQQSYSNKRSNNNQKSSYKNNQKSYKNQNNYKSDMNKNSNQDSSQQMNYYNRNGYNESKLFSILLPSQVITRKYSRHAP